LIVEIIAVVKCDMMLCDECGKATRNGKIEYYNNGSIEFFPPENWKKVNRFKFLCENCTKIKELPIKILNNETISHEDIPHRIKK